MNQITLPLWPLSFSRSLRVIDRACLCTFCARRRLWLIMPAATVAWLKRSTRMKPPSVFERA